MSYNERNTAFSEVLNHLAENAVQSFRSIKSYIKDKTRAQEDKKIENAKRKFEQQRANAISKFHKHLNLPENATQEDLDNAVLNVFASTDLAQSKLLPLTNDQLSNADFMLKLYEIKPELISHYDFKPSEELQQDVDFMAKYTKIKFLDRCQSMDKYGIHQNFDYFFLASIPNADNLFSNPKMIENLSAEMPERNVLSVVKNFIFRNQYYAFFKKEETIQKYKDLVNGCSFEYLSAEAEKFGKNFISLIPDDNPNIIELMSSAVSCDGFNSLSILPIENYIVTQTDSNEEPQHTNTTLNPEVKDLIIKAYEKDGFDNLKTFVLSSLNPHRYETYMCHGEIHDYSYYSLKHSDVQTAILYDPDIYTIFAENFVAKQETPEA